MNVAAVQDQLRARAFLHDDPDAYLAGVKDAVTVLVEQAEVEGAGTQERAEGA